MLLKSSDFIVHDLSADSVFEGCEKKKNNDDDDDDGDDQGTTACGVYELELVLRKWFAIDPSREMRAFVREGVLVGACVGNVYVLYDDITLTHLWKGQACRSAMRTITSF
jgi:hypothetical protein